MTETTKQRVHTEEGLILSGVVARLQKSRATCATFLLEQAKGWDDVLVSRGKLTGLDEAIKELNQEIKRVESGRSD